MGCAGDSPTPHPPGVSKLTGPDIGWEKEEKDSAVKDAAMDLVRLLSVLGAEFLETQSTGRLPVVSLIQRGRRCDFGWLKPPLINWLIYSQGVIIF